MATYAPIKHQIPKAPRWEDLLTEEGKIKWSEVPSAVLNLASLLDPTMGLMMPLRGATRATSWKALNIKKTLGSDILKEIVDKGYTPEVRRKIFEKLAFTPERKELFKQVAPVLEEIYGSSPSIAKGRAYLFGSVASTKPNPSDVDVLIRPWNDPYVGNIVYEILTRSGLGEKLHPMVVPRLAIPKGLTASKRMAGPSWAQSMIRGSREKYGKSYEPIRLWGTAPVPFTSILDFLNEE